MFREGMIEPLEQDRIELLRTILETEQGRPVSYDEAAEIADTMINFYQTLADGLSADDLVEISE
jgi:hypothetical protein